MAQAPTVPSKRRDTGAPTASAGDPLFLKLKALRKKLADVQQKNTLLEKQLGEATAASKKLQEEKGALEAKSAQYQQLASSLQDQIASGQVEISELRGKMTVNPSAQRTHGRHRA